MHYFSADVLLECLLTGREFFFFPPKVKVFVLSLSLLSSPFLPSFLTSPFLSLSLSLSLIYAKLVQLVLIYASMGKMCFSHIFRIKYVQTHKSKLAGNSDVKLACL